MKNKLKQYQEKRNFKKTKEPIGKETKSEKKLHFIVQHHIARKDHYDLRLEWNGTLKSFAIPKGPSYDPTKKRLAIKVEDHPLEYRHFEGTIPKGQYGGGTVMLWDKGYWICENKTKPNFQKTLKFTLKGERLKGKWTLIHLKENQWLLKKEEDEYQNLYQLTDFKTSIKTQRTMEEIANSKTKILNSKKKHILSGIEISNPDKIIFDKPKTTKFEIASYYQKVSKRMMPFLENRIISTIRCPEGIHKERFFKKHFEKQNKDLSKIKITNKQGQKKDYYYIKDQIGLLKEVQMNSYEFHLWGSKVTDLNHPDMLVFDLDPDTSISLSQLRQGVKDLKKILDDLNIKSYLKTSGNKGYHVVVHTKVFKNWRDFRNFAKNIAELMEKKWPSKYVSNPRLKNRKNKIFIDWMRNTKSATSVAPYSIRTKQKPTVSMPISWQELDKIKPDEITLKEAIKRLKRKDPWQDFFISNP